MSFCDLLRSPDVAVRDLAAHLFAFAQGDPDNVPPLAELVAVPNLR